MTRRMLFAFAVICSLAGCGASGDQGDKDLLQGHWTTLSAEENGKSIPELAKMNLSFAGDQVTFKEPLRDGSDPKASKTEKPGEPIEIRGTFKLDPTQSPKHIDLSLDGDKPQRGIYVLEGDSLKLIMGNEGDAPRPTSLTPGPGIGVITLKRAK